MDESLFLRLENGPATFELNLQYRMNRYMYHFKIILSLPTKLKNIYRVIEFYFQNSHTMFHLFFDLSDNVSGIFFTGISCI